MPESNILIERPTNGVVVVVDRGPQGPQGQQGIPGVKGDTGERGLPGAPSIGAGQGNVTGPVGGVVDGQVALWDGSSGMLLKAGEAPGESLSSLGAKIRGATLKPVLADADSIAIGDSGPGGAMVRATWGAVKTMLNALFIAKNGIKTINGQSLEGVGDLAIAGGAGEVTLSTAQTLSGKTLRNPAYVTQTLVDDDAIVWDMENGHGANLTLGPLPAGVLRTMSSPLNLKDGTFGSVRIYQDTTGNRKVDLWGSAFRFPGGVTPVLSTLPNKCDVLTWVSDGTLIYVTSVSIGVAIANSTGGPAPSPGSSTAPPGTSTPPPPAPTTAPPSSGPAPMTLQAETATLAGTLTVASASALAGFEGDGYVEWFTTDGDRVTFNFPMTLEGVYDLTIRYSRAAVSTQKYSINGAPDQDVVLPATSGWGTYTFENVTLAAGIASLSIAKGIDGYFYLDSATRTYKSGTGVNAPAPTPAPPAGTTYTIQAEDATRAGSLAIEQTIAGYNGTGHVVFWDSADDILTFNFNAIAAGVYDLKVRLSSGAFGPRAFVQLNTGNDISVSFGGNGWEDLTVATGVNLAAGNHTVKVKMQDGFYSCDEAILTPTGGIPPAPGPIKDIALWGDSMTQAMGDDLDALYADRAVYNGGVIGESSSQIETRFLADTVRRSNYTFIWAGHNDYYKQGTAQNIADMVAALTAAGNADYCIVGNLPWANSQFIGGPERASFDALHTTLSSTYGSKYLDLHAYILTQGDGTAGDIADINAGIIPRSLRYVGDDIHLNEVGQARVAARFQQFIGTTAAPPPPPPPPPATGLGAGGETYLFGTQRQSIPNTHIKPNSATFAQRTTQLRQKYDEWKATNVITANQIVQGGYSVRFKPDRMYVSEGLGMGAVLLAIFAGHDPMARTIFDGIILVARARPAYAIVQEHGLAIGNYLMNWRAGPNGEPDWDSGGGGGYAAHDGDLDLVYGLLMAHRQWGSGGAINYRQEALLRIEAMKVWFHYNDTARRGLLRTRPTENMMRTSDVMLNHFNEFYNATGDDFWLAAKEINLRKLEQYVEAYSPTYAIIPDALVNTNTNTPRRTNPGERVLDFDPDVDREGFMYSNAQRNPWRLGIAYLYEPDAAIRARLKVLCDKFINFCKLDTSGFPERTATGYHPDGRIGDIGDGRSGGILFRVYTQGWMPYAMVGPQLCAAMVDASHQQYLDRLWTANVQYFQPKYYDAELQLTPMLIAAGCFWSPTGTIA